MATIKKWFVPNLSELVKNKEKFEELDKKVQSQILTFLADSKIIAHNNRVVKRAMKEIKEANALTKKLKKNVTKIHPIIKNLPNGYSLTDLYVEKDRNSYRLDVHWIGLRKKCSLGTDLKKIEKICKHHSLNKEIRLNQTNFKEVIRQCLNDALNDFFIDCGYERIKNADKIYIEKNEFKIKDSEGVNLSYNDKPSKKPSSVENNPSNSPVFSGSGVGFHSKNFSNNPFKSPTTVDDTPKHLTYQTEKKIYIGKRRKKG